MTVSKNRQHFDFKNFLIRCILDYAQPHLVDFWKKRPANFNFIWLEWNSYNSSIQIHIVWSRSSIFKLKSSPAQGCFHKIEIKYAKLSWFQGLKWGTVRFPTMPESRDIGKNVQKAFFQFYTFCKKKVSTWCIHICSP